MSNDNAKLADISSYMRRYIESADTEVDTRLDEASWICEAC